MLKLLNFTKKVIIGPNHSNKTCGIKIVSMKLLVSEIGMFDTLILFTYSTKEHVHYF